MPAATQPNTPHPQETRLDFLLGEWRSAGRVYPGPFGAGGESAGTTVYQRDLDGRWLLYTSRLHLPGLPPYEVRGGVVYDAAAGRYSAYAINNLGNLLVHDGRWQDEMTLVFDLVHPPAPGGSRVVYVKQPDGSVKMTSERSNDGLVYDAYFETVLTRD